MRTITHLIVGALAATALVAGSATTASAQTEKIKDKRADVVHYADAFEDMEGTILDRELSIASGIDATSATFKHSKKSLKVTIKFAKLTKERFYLQSSVRVKGSKKSPKFIISNDGNKKKVFVYDRNMDKKLCTAKLNRKTGDKGSVTFTIKRKCFDKAKSIKLQTTAFSFPNGLENGETIAVNAESISSAKKKTPAWTKWLKAS